jgi:hypothetical protein
MTKNISKPTIFQCSPEQPAQVINNLDEPISFTHALTSRAYLNAHLHSIRKFIRHTTIDAPSIESQRV